MTKNIIITVLSLLLLLSGSIAVIASSSVNYQTSFYYKTGLSKVDVNTYNYENMSCVIVVTSNYNQSNGSPAISCIKNN